MHLFENEVFHISGIRSVRLHKTEEDFPPGVTLRHFSTHIKCYELIYFLAGENTTYIGNKKLHDKENAIRYLPRCENIGRYDVQNISPGPCIDIYFYTDDPMPQEALILNDMTEVREHFIKMQHIWANKRPGYYAKTMSLFYELIAKIGKQQQKYLPQRKWEKIAPAGNYLFAHYTDVNFNYREMCEQSGLCYDYFKELFEQRYGMTPRAYVTYLKMELAKELLFSEKYTVTQIAALCGFENIYYFSTLFKKHTGQTPTEYRKNEEKL